MGKYGKAAILATKNYYNSNFKDITQAWHTAMLEIFPIQVASRKKGCPKAAFLGLCEAGYVSGVPKGEYLKKENSDNKRYAIDAVNLLNNSYDLTTTSPANLWKLVMNGESKTPNSQMDVVLSLWKHGLIAN